MAGGVKCRIRKDSNPLTANNIRRGAPPVSRSRRNRPPEDCPFSARTMPGPRRRVVFGAHHAGTAPESGFRRNPAGTPEEDRPETLKRIEAARRKYDNAAGRRFGGGGAPPPGFPGICRRAI